MTGWNNRNWYLSRGSTSSSKVIVSASAVTWTDKLVRVRCLLRQRLAHRTPNTVVQEEGAPDALKRSATLAVMRSLTTSSDSLRSPVTSK